MVQLTSRPEGPLTHLYGDATMCAGLFLSLFNKKRSNSFRYRGPHAGGTDPTALSSRKESATMPIQGCGCCRKGMGTDGGTRSRCA